MTIRALAFDFDGLILETETPAYQAWADVRPDEALAFEDPRNGMLAAQALRT